MTNLLNEINRKIRLSDDFNYYIIYNEGGCGKFYIIDREKMDELLVQKKLEPVKEDGKLTYAQYKAFLNFAEEDQYNSQPSIKKINFGETNAYYMNTPERGFLDKVARIMSGRFMYDGHVYETWGIKHLNGDANKDWELYYNKHYSGEGVKCEFILNGVRRFIKFKSKTIANMIKKIVRTSRERNNGEWRGTTYIPNTFWHEYTKLLIDERTHDEANKAYTIARNKLYQEANEKTQLKDCKQPLIEKMFVLRRDRDNKGNGKLDGLYRQRSKEIRENYGISNGTIDKYTNEYYDYRMNGRIDEQPLKIYLKHKNKSKDTVSK